MSWDVPRGMVCDKGGDQACSCDCCEKMADCDVVRWMTNIRSIYGETAWARCLIEVEEWKLDKITYKAQVVDGWKKNSGSLFKKIA